MALIQEINGVLHKITEQKIDQFNVVRKAVPLTEEEFEDIHSKITKAQAEEQEALNTAKTKGKLKKKADLEKFEEVVKTSAPIRKPFSIGK